jgi:hypothetical protein
MTGHSRAPRSAGAGIRGALAVLVLAMTALPMTATPTESPARSTHLLGEVGLSTALEKGRSGGSGRSGSGGGHPRVSGPARAAARAAARASRRAEHARALAARRAAKAQAAAARRAAQAAAAAASAQSNWIRTGHPDQLVIVRARHIDWVSGGRLSRRVARPGGPLTLSGLARYLPPGWLSVPGDGSAQLNASIVLTAGTVLDNGPDVHVLTLASGPDSGTAAGLWVGQATANLHGLSVTSAAPSAGTPPGQRGFLVAGSGATLTVADATLSNLGAPPPPKPLAVPTPAPGTAAPGPPTPTAPTAPWPAAGPAGIRIEPGVVFGPGSTGSILRSTLTGNGVGVKLSGSRNVHLDTVTVARSLADGLILHGDTGTTINGVHSQHNAGNGVLVDGPGPNRGISGIDTGANNRFGLAVIGQTQPHIAAVSSIGDHAGGIRLTATTGATLTQVSSTDSPVGVLINGPSNHLTLTEVHTRGGLRGIVVTGGVRGVEIARAQVADASKAGVVVSGTDNTLHQISISGSATGLQVVGRAARTTLTDAHISGGRTGIRIARGAAVVVLDQVSTDAVSGTGISTASPGTRITGSRIEGGTTGINARAGADIAATSIGGVHEGIHTGPGVQVSGKQLQVAAASSGIKVDPGGVFVLTDSHVGARVALRGQVNLLGTNTISPPPFNWIGGFGIVFIVLAFLLESLRHVRRRANIQHTFTPVGDEHRAAQAEREPALAIQTSPGPTMLPAEAHHTRPTPIGAARPRREGEDHGEAVG